MKYNIIIFKQKYEVGYVFLSPVQRSRRRVLVDFLRESMLLKLSQFWIYTGLDFPLTFSRLCCENKVDLY